MPCDEEDIVTCSSFLKEEEIRLNENLKENTNYLNYDSECEVTIAHLITLSRRRLAESGDALLENYLNRNKTTNVSENTVKAG